MENSIHQTNAPHQPPEEKSKIKEWIEKLPLIQWVGAAIVGICVTWSTLQVTQANQIYEINALKNDQQSFKLYIQNLKAERDKQLDEIEQKMVDKAVFDERTNMILKQIDLQRQERKEDREYFERILLNSR